MLKLYNTLTHKKEYFKPKKDKKVGLYTCGPTVYWYAHIGNLRTYIFEDILKRVLEYNGYKVKHVMNITDVGHLTSDADVGEDKLEKGAKREKKTVWEIAEFYTRAFKQDLKKLNIKEPDVWIKATDTIKDQIRLIKILEKKGFTYKTDDGIYFDTSKLKTYGRLWGKNKKKIEKGLIAGFRVKMGKKKNPTDFALWKFSPKNKKRQMEWDSPWGIGFPGWHTECVVMGIKNLGIPFDIHCGGIDHIPIHHTNEIAQAEGAYNKILAHYWLHSEFLILKKGKMAKSEGNIIILSDIIKKGFNPLAYRYLCLNTHYRSKLTFSWKAIEGAQNSLNSLYDKIRDIKFNTRKIKSNLPANQKEKSIRLYKNKFLAFINNDLNTPKALALAWQVIKNNKIPNHQKYNLLVDFDRIFGLDLDKIKRVHISEKLKRLIEKREKYRQEKKWQEADKIREMIKKMGYLIEDTKNGTIVKKIKE